MKRVRRLDPTEPTAVGRFTLPVGYERFHRNQLYNYQLNRPYSLGTGRYDDLAAAGAGIRSFADWKAALRRQAERAEGEGRWLNAAAYWRGAEFYTFSGDPDKAPFYDRYMEAFYRGIEGDPVRRARVPFGDHGLPALVVEPDGPARGTVVLHGGYDSFIEEFYPMLLFFAAGGWRAIGFEGPGQGAVRRKAGLPMDWRWERPVAAVLDHFGLDDVTLVGLSMGGWFALRAAAFEPRVGRVIANGHAYDYMKISRAPAATLMVFFHDHFRSLTNRLSQRQIRHGGMQGWNISHLMYITATAEPMAAFELAMALTEENQCPGRVRQDVLVMSSKDDHFIPYRLHAYQLDRLGAARSVASRVFTRREHAGNHCQVGNIGLSLRVMRGWLEEKEWS